MGESIVGKSFRVVGKWMTIQNTGHVDFRPGTILRVEGTLDYPGPPGFYYEFFVVRKTHNSNGEEDRIVLYVFSAAYMERHITEKNLEEIHGEIGVRVGPIECTCNGKCGQEGKPKPASNDGLAQCAWCGAPTRKAGGGAYDVCTACGK